MNSPLHEDAATLLGNVPANGSPVGNIKLRKALGWDEARYVAARDQLLKLGVLALGRGRGGSVKRVTNTSSAPPGEMFPDESVDAAPPSQPSEPAKVTRKTTDPSTPDTSYRNPEAQRKNIPPAGLAPRSTVRQPGPHAHSNNPQISVLSSTVLGIPAQVQLARLSALVATLGSKHHDGWWNCSFLSPEGLATLAYNFPRTALSAAVTATAKASAGKHDQAAGAVGVFHLFRLPPVLAEQVHRHLITEGASFATMLLSRDSCLEALGDLAGDPSGDLGPGARNLGNFGTEGGSLVNRLATAYATAFADGYQTFPYFILS